ncbi:cytoplasmic protein [Chroococcidiopsis sp.]|uniref:cytoplasmic protein n=1 Tax=Chroococcidiopsis sp. TaxID=3088168 RepID=UPI003F2BF570
MVTWKGCGYCKHLTKSSFCKAFPDGTGIPLFIANGEIPHLQKIGGQKNDIVYEEK